jgi:hypothetical protein
MRRYPNAQFAKLRNTLLKQGMTSYPQCACGKPAEPRSAECAECKRLPVRTGSGRIVDPRD